MEETPPRLARQLSFDVEHVYKDLDPIETLSPIGCSVKVGGSIPIPFNLACGERLVVVVSDADGQVLGQAECVVGAPAFKEVKVKGVGVIGLERIEKAKVDG